MALNTAEDRFLHAIVTFICTQTARTQYKFHFQECTETGRPSSHNLISNGFSIVVFAPADSSTRLQYLFQLRPSRVLSLHSHMGYYLWFLTWQKITVYIYLENPSITTVPDRRCRILKVVLVRRWVTWVLGIWRGEDWGKGWERGGQFTSNLRPRWTDPVTARRVPSK